VPACPAEEGQRVRVKPDRVTERETSGTIID